MSRYFVFGLSLMVISLVACSNIRVTTIPPPPPTAKLRIYVQAVQTEPTQQGNRGRGAKWGKSLEEFKDVQVIAIERILNRSGIYEVVSDDDVNAVVGEQQPARWEFERGNWTLARQIALALHADYALIVERGTSGIGPFFESVLINATTGKRFGVSFQPPSHQKGQRERKWPKGTVGAVYRELFNDARADLLGTAIRKSRLLVHETTLKSQAPTFDNTMKQIPSFDKKPESPAIAKLAEEKTLAQSEKERTEKERTEKERTEKERSEKERLVQEKALVLKAKIESEQADQEKERVRVEKERAYQEKALAQREKERTEKERLIQEGNAAKKKASESDQKPEEKKPEPLLAKTIPSTTTEGGSRIIDIESIFVEDAPVRAGERLVIYDLEAPEHLRPTALLLSESLREELFQFHRFSLVNRENLIQFMDELKFQQSGLVDEKQAVQLGKGMAANQIVTGRIGSIGEIYILQAKRTDLQSLNTRALGSLQCKQGEEVLLLKQLPALAKKLAEGP